MDSIGGTLVGCFPQLNACLVHVSIKGETPKADLEATIKKLISTSDGLIKDAYLEDSDTDAAGSDANLNTGTGQDDQWHLKRVQTEEAWALLGGVEQWFGVGVVDDGVSCNRLNALGGDKNCIISFSGIKSPTTLPVSPL